LTSFELMTEEVQVWVASLEVADVRYASLSKTLSREEQGRAEGMPPGLARRFVVARRCRAGDSPFTLVWLYGDRRGGIAIHVRDFRETVTRR